uniref:Uncharacterized protein n=1 Tax=Gouania willdenowi TaxID=441366 RepID=A0A8C5GGR5_GOUWI
MATVGYVLSKEQLLCPICLDLFEQPVSTPCGHNFCHDCIKKYWKSVTLPQCPMCKHKLYKRPNLKVNTFISEVASQFKQLLEKKSKTNVVDQSTSRKEEISCDVCLGKEIKALKSCLDCLASFCETHLEPHHVLATFKKHRLISPTMSMQDRVCKKHEKLLDLFCTSDMMFVCNVCVQKDHKAHHIVCIEVKSKDRRAEIGSIKEVVEEMIDSRQQKISEINQSVAISKRNTEMEIEESSEVFDNLLQLVQRGHEDVAELIRARQKQIENKASEFIKALEKEIDQLTHRSGDLKHLSHTEDNLYHLRTLPAIKDWSDVRADSADYVGTMRRAVRRVMSQLETMAQTEVNRLCEAEFQRARRYAVDVTLDPNTAHPKLVVSENKKQVYHSDVPLSVPDNPERFYPGVSVLGKEGFSSGKFYFEVQVEGKTEWDIGIGLESVSRKGGCILNPERGYWALGMRSDQSYWALDNPPVCVPLIEKPHSVGVYVDMGWGQVSFYNADTHSHIFTFTGYSFSGRVFPYLNPRRNHGGVNSVPLIILPVNVLCFK